MIRKSVARTRRPQVFDLETLDARHRRGSMGRDGKARPADNA